MTMSNSRGIYITFELRAFFSKKNYITLIVIRNYIFESLYYLEFNICAGLNPT